jgi:hypothetical protein
LFGFLQWYVNTMAIRLWFLTFKLPSSCWDDFFVLTPLRSAFCLNWLFDARCYQSSEIC